MGTWICFTNDYYSTGVRVILQNLESHGRLFLTCPMHGNFSSFLYLAILWHFLVRAMYKPTCIRINVVDIYVYVHTFVCTYIWKCSSIVVLFNSVYTYIRPTSLMTTATREAFSNLEGNLKIATLFIAFSITPWHEYHLVLIIITII